MAYNFFAVCDDFGNMTEKLKEGWENCLIADWLGQQTACFSEVSIT